MPSDEYSLGVRGALKLKGGKVEKHRHKHKHKHKRRGKDTDTDKEKEKEKAAEDRLAKAVAAAGDSEKKEDVPDDVPVMEVDDPYTRMTESERRFAEAQEKKIRDLMMASPEEARAKHPELFKSHRERLADLNTYLSRMTEHHDMPKIGPG